MVDKVKPLKIENPASGGSSTDPFPTETNPAQDYLAAKGMSFEGLDTRLLDLTPAGELAYRDAGQIAQKTLNSIATMAENARFALVMSFNGARSAGGYLDVFDGVTSQTCGLVIPRNCKIVEISLATIGVSTCSIRLRNNGTVIPLATVSTTASSKGFTTGLNLALAAGDQLSADVLSGSSTRPTLLIFIQYT